MQFFGFIRQSTCFNIKNCKRKKNRKAVKKTTILLTMDVASNSTAGNEVHSVERPPKIVNNEIQDTGGLSSVANNEIQDTGGLSSLANNEIQDTGGLSSLANNEIQDTGGLSSVANNEIQDTGGLATVANNEIQDTGGLASVANNEIQGAECPAVSGQDDASISNHDASPGTQPRHSLKNSILVHCH